MVLMVSDLSSILKAESFVILCETNRFETTSNKVSEIIDTSKILHEFKMFSMYKENLSLQATVVVIVE
ncbi:MAG: hypothetical protein N2Z58_07065 [Fervidobacterium sp.]|nr:hypothetical protein [Fervidobacterium sp.]